MKIYTIENGAVSEGAKIEEVKLKCDVTIDAIIVGEEGRGPETGHPSDFRSAHKRMSKLEKENPLF